MRGQAAQALGALGDARARDPLLAALRGDKEQSVCGADAAGLWALIERLPEILNTRAGTGP